MQALQQPAKWNARPESRAAVQTNQPGRRLDFVQESRGQSNKTAIDTLERLVGHLEANGSQPDPGLLSEICAAVASILQVSADEVALLKLAPHSQSLGFVLPVKLQGAGAIPIESKVAVAARSVRERRPELDNKFLSHPHARVFEVISSPERDTTEPIQKIMSVPVFCGDELIGVAQVSRKGATTVAAGPDFTGKDLKQLQEINALLARIIATVKIDVVATPAGEPASKTQNPALGRQRRAPRVAIAIPVEVIYQGPGNKMVTEEAKTFAVSACGAGIVLKNAPQIDQVIVVIHKLTREEVFCRVANTGPIPKTTNHEVGVAFEDSRPYFWHIAFPSPDHAMERKQFAVKR